MDRAYSTLTIKSVDDDLRVIEGIASTPSTDRMGDIVEPTGAEFTLPIPLLWQHRSDQPIGHVTAAKVTKSGIAITAKIAKGVLPSIDEAWALIKAGLVRGLSIGFQSLESARIDGTFGVRFTKWSWLELSAVTIAANQDASITTIRSLDAVHLAASGNGNGTSHHTSGASDARVAVAKTTARGVSMTVSDQIKSYEASRETKRARMDAIMAKSAEAGTTLDVSESEEYDTLEGEVTSINKHVERLNKLEAANVSSLKPVDGTSVEKASITRAGQVPVITVRENVPAGLGFARAVLCDAAAYIGHRNVAEVAKQRYPDFAPLHNHFETKAAVPAGTATQAVWGGPLVYATNLESEFVEFLRPQTVVGKLTGLRRVPFNVRIPSQTGGGTGYWVGEGAPKPLTSFAFSSSSLGYTKVAAIAVITQELARFSSPNADMLTRDALVGALVERIDIDFIDPAEAAIANVKPASITNGLVARTSAGTSADNARTDIGSLLNVFLSANLNPASLVLIMPNTLAMALSLMVNSLGQPEFPGLTMNGGTLQGIPVVTSQYAANASGGGNLVIAVNQSDIFLADDGQVTVDASTEASLQMSDAPTGGAVAGAGASVVSMYQTNCIALRAERFINWAKRRSEAVVYMDDVNWGTVGSPS